MPTLNVHIKHAGKFHDLPLNTDAPATVFKESVYQATGVPVDRMKVMVKGGVLKDDTDWKKVAPKEGQTFMVIGAAGELPKPPPTPIVFLEDMNESELAEALSLPVGLRNLGNTCYMNASLQALRAIPELQTALDAYPQSTRHQGGGTVAARERQGNDHLARALRDLYTGMRTTTDPFTPLSFLTVLRDQVPQFGELARGGKSSFGGAGYAQQDAEEFWVQIVNSLRALPGDATEGSTQSNEARKALVEQFLMAEMRRELKCDEAPEEPPSVSIEKVMKLECNISKDTNYLITGIKDALDQKIEKNSPSLGRQAVYTASSRLSRIPQNLTVHMVRFAWKREIQKKAKIMRRVKFPVELDVLKLCTEELSQKLHPVNTKLKELERDRAERRKVRKRTKKASAEASSTPDVEMADASSATASAPAPTNGSDTATSTATVTATAAAPTPAGEDKGKGKAPADAVEGGELEPEHVYRARELAELEALVPADVRADVGASATGLYELVGIVAHKGAAADSGHYIGFVKKSALHQARKGVRGEEENLKQLEEDDEDWYKFDDEKVSVFPKDKLATLEGGGEDASAYVLLYRSKPLA